jgi:hypothetical protein
MDLRLVSSSMSRAFCSEAFCFIHRINGWM